MLTLRPVYLGLCLSSSSLEFCPFPGISYRTNASSPSESMSIPSSAVKTYSGLYLIFLPVSNLGHCCAPTYNTAALLSLDTTPHADLLIEYEAP